MRGCVPGPHPRRYVNLALHCICLLIHNTLPFRVHSRDRRRQHNAQLFQIQRANPRGHQRRDRRKNGSTPMADQNGGEITATDHPHLARLLHVLSQKLPEKHRTRQQIHHAQIHGDR